MTITYSPLLSAAYTAALQSRERYVLAALRGVPLEGAFRWTLSTDAGGAEYITLRHANEDNCCVVWLTPAEVRRAFTESRIATLIGEQRRTVPGHE